MREEAHKKTIYKTYRRFKWLLFGYLLGTAISAIITILLARLMGPADYGLYAAAFILPSVISSIGDLGMSRATIYYVASLRENNLNDALRYFKSSLIAVCLQSIMFTVLVVVFAYPLTSLVFGKEYLAPYVQVASLMIFYTSATGVINGGLLSLEKQKVIALFVIMTSTVRNLLALFLYIQSREALLALIGQIIGYISMATIYIAYACTILRGVSTDFKLVWPMLRYGFPYSIGMFIITLSSQFYNIVAVSLLDKTAYGNFGAAWFIFSASSIIPSSLSTSFFPSFSEEYSSVSMNTSTTYNVAVKFSATILLYLWLVLGGLSDIFVSIVYGNAYTLAGGILASLTSIFILSILGWGIVIPLLLTFKETKVIAAISFLGVGGSMIVFLSGQKFGFTNPIWLIPLALFFLNLISTIVGLAYIVRRYGIKLEKMSMAKMFIIAIFLFYLVRELGLNTTVLLRIFGSVQISNILTIGISAVWIGITYISLLIIAGALRKDDYEMLRKTLFSLPLLGIVDRVAEKAFIINIKVNGLIQKIVEKPSGKKGDVAYESLIE